MATIYHLNWTGDSKAREQFTKLHIDDGEGTARRENYTRIAEDPEATLETVFRRWNMGSGRECELFKELRVCEECGEQVRGEDEAEAHEETHHEGEKTTNGYRSLSVGDIIELDDGLHRVATRGFDEVEWADETQSPD